MSAANADDPNRLYTRIFTRITRGWSSIYSLRTVAKAGLPHAAGVVAEQHRQFMDELISTGKLEEFVIGIDDPAKLHETGDFLRRQLTAETLKSASNSVDAASLVFAHTVLDDALNSFLGLTLIVARHYWEGRVKGRKVELEQVMQQALSDIVGASMMHKCFGLQIDPAALSDTQK